METNPHGPRWLYLHGFASSPDSFKARALADHYGALGVELERLDLRRPSFEHLRLTAIMDYVVSRIGGPRDRAVLVGSSLGGMAACRTAERDPRICAMVLLAPAFDLARRWRQRLGGDGWNAWRTSGWLETLDHKTKTMGRVDHGFVQEVAALDVHDGGFPDVRVPTLIVHGVHDDTVPIEGSRAFAQGRRHVTLVEVEDGHELTASIPAITAAADGFLAPLLGVR